LGAFFLKSPEHLIIFFSRPTGQEYVQGVVASSDKNKLSEGTSSMLNELISEKSQAPQKHIIVYRLDLTEEANRFFNDHFVDSPQDTYRVPLYFSAGDGNEIELLRTKLEGDGVNLGNCSLHLLTHRITKHTCRYGLFEADGVYSCYANKLKGIAREIGKDNCYVEVMLLDSDPELKDNVKKAFEEVHAGKEFNARLHCKTLFAPLSSMFARIFSMFSQQGEPTTIEAKDFESQSKLNTSL